MVSRFILGLSLLCSVGAFFSPTHVRQHPAARTVTRMSAIAEGQRLPLDSIKFKVLKDEKGQDVTGKELFAGKKVVLFAVPGAFTPTCSCKHVPGFLEKHDAIKAQGVDTIACLATNDAYVMDAWAKDLGATDKILFLSDGDFVFTKAFGLEKEGSSPFVRIKRLSMLVEDGVVKKLNVETGGPFGVSSADTMLEQLAAVKA